MKCSIVIAEGCRQVMLTPENDSEREALKYMTPSDGEAMSVAMKPGRFDDGKETTAGFYVDRCRGGWFRRFADDESLMVIIEREPQ